MIPLFESGALRPVIDSRFAFDDIAEAHRRMESNANVGKILITVARPRQRRESDNPRITTLRPASVTEYCPQGQQTERP